MYKILNIVRLLPVQPDSQKPKDSQPKCERKVAKPWILEAENRKSLAFSFKNDWNKYQSSWQLIFI